MPNFRFFQHVQVSFQVFLAGKGRTVDPLEHLVVLISPPVGTGDAHELEGFHPAGRRAVRAGAQVREVSLGVGADHCIFRQVFDQFHFVRFIFSLEFGQGFRSGQFFPDQGIVGFDLAHFFFNGPQIFRREHMVAVQVVVEALFNGRPDGELGAREQMLDGLGHHMGGRMADGMEPFFTVRGNEFHFGIMIQGIAQVFVFPIYFGQECGLPQFLVQALGNGQQGAAGFEFFHAAVGQADFDARHI